MTAPTTSSVKSSVPSSRRKTGCDGVIAEGAAAPPGLPEAPCSLMLDRQLLRAHQCRLPLGMARGPNRPWAEEGKRLAHCDRKTNNAHRPDVAQAPARLLDLDRRQVS